MAMHPKVKALLAALAEEVGDLELDETDDEDEDLSWKNPSLTGEGAWVSRMKNIYNLTEADYWALYEQQGRGCAICHAPFTITSRKRQGKKAVSRRRLAVDHDHATGKVRGLLCANCNSGIGMLQDEPRIIADAYRYLMRRKTSLMPTSSK